MSSRRTFAAFYLFVALRWFRLTGALWMLYLMHVGWSLWQVGIAEAAFHVVSFLAGIPTGAYADRLGRRRSLVVGLAIGSVGCMGILLLAPVSVLLGTVAMGISGLSWCFIGGADQAWLNDLTRLLPDGEAAYSRLFGRMDALCLLSGALAAVVGGWLAIHLGWDWPFGGEAVASALAIPIVLSLPRAQSAAAPAGAPKELMSTMRDVWAITQSVPAIRYLVIFGALLGVVVTSNHLYAQTTLVAKGQTIVAATAVIGISSLVGAAASALTHRLGEGLRAARALRALSLLIAVVIGTMGVAGGVGAPLLYATTGLIDGALNVLFVTELNRRSPEALRATILSAPESAFSLGMIVCFPLEGWAMGRFGLGPVYAALGAVLCITVLLTLGRARRSVAGSLAAVD